jgi:hypothetical protein
MVPQRSEIPRLAVGPRPDEPVSLPQCDEALPFLTAPPKCRLDHLGHIARTDRPMTAIQTPQLLEHLPCLRHPVGLTFDPHLAMTGQHFDPQSVADLAKVLISTAEDSKLLVVTVEADHGFRHA